jgi:hypothetical protein
VVDSASSIVKLSLVRVGVDRGRFEVCVAEQLADYMRTHTRFFPPTRRFVSEIGQVKSSQACDRTGPVPSRANCPQTLPVPDRVTEDMRIRRVSLTGWSLPSHLQVRRQSARDWQHAIFSIFCVNAANPDLATSPSRHRATGVRGLRPAGNTFQGSRR